MMLTMEKATMENDGKNLLTIVKSSKDGGLDDGKGYCGKSGLTIVETLVIRAS